MMQYRAVHYSTVPNTAQYSINKYNAGVEPSTHLAVSDEVHLVTTLPVSDQRICVLIHPLRHAASHTQQVVV
jgi:hypothetical protein